ncbi:uncharacterized protein [Euphorbia lathyris]|uniref:uncharacterized protein n=1 Tax=Euphorbia lathyris TaxID=212925 RepID=UPI00331319D5
MPSKMKIQPIDSLTPEEATPLETVKPVVKSRLKRLFELQFLKNSTADKVGVFCEPHFNKDSSKGSVEFEPSSECLASMVQNFIEESNEKNSSAALRCGRSCNCFNRNCNDSSEDELDDFGDCNFLSFGESIENLKSMVACASVSERNLLADTAKIVEKNKICKRKDDGCRKIVIEGLLALGYDASICKSHWERSPTHLAGEYEYIDVIILGERLLIDIDFRSEFEIARSTKGYMSLLEILPCIFVGKADRLQKIISLISDAAKRSLKKKGMHIPPWRKAEYVKAKWLSPHTRARPNFASIEPEKNQSSIPTATAIISESSLSVHSIEDAELGESVFTLSSESSMEEESVMRPPEIKSKSFQSGIKIVTGLASIIDGP